MAFIGNSVQTQGFTPAIDYFSGNGSTVTFTLSRPVASVAQMIVAIDNVIQNPSSSFTVSGSAITFSSAPLAGTNNIWVEYTSLITTYNAISQSPSVIGDITASGGFFAKGNFNNTYDDGVVVDYVTGNGRVTVGSADGFTLYTGGTSGRTALASWTQTGALTLPADATINGLTVGKGGGSDTASTTVGYLSLGAGATNTGTNNTSVGYGSMYVNTSGSSNSAFGGGALRYNTTGGSNSAIGFQALNQNTTASNNTAVGYQAGYSNTTGGSNVFIGGQAGFSSVATTVNAGNTVIGYQAGYGLTTGVANVFIGSNNAGSVSGSGAAITSGSKNTIIGSYNGNQGGLDIRTASNYIVLSDGDGNPRIYHNGTTMFCPSVFTNTTASSANMYMWSTGDMGRSTSALKYKQDVRDLPAIDINSFRPVVYKSKCDNDDQTKDHFGIIADEVDAAGITELVTYSAEGEVEGFQYERLTVVLLKELQEQQAMIEELKTKVAALEAKNGY